MTTRLAAVLAALTLLVAHPLPAAATEPWHHGISTFYSWQEYGCGVYRSWAISCARRGHFACGGLYQRAVVAVAHLTLPCGTRVELRNPAYGLRIVAVVRDRGPFTAGRDFDLTTATCLVIRACRAGPLDWRVLP